MILPISQMSKARVYEWLYEFNRGLEITLAGLAQLEQFDLFPGDVLRAYKNQLERTQAMANEEIAEALQQFESEQAAEFDRLERAREKQIKDPDDVFFAANDRRREIMEQIRSLQKSLQREQRTETRRRRK